MKITIMLGLLIVEGRYHRNSCLPGCQRSTTAAARQILCSTNRTSKSWTAGISDPEGCRFRRRNPIRSSQATGSPRRRLEIPRRWWKTRPARPETECFLRENVRNETQGAQAQPAQNGHSPMCVLAHQNLQCAVTCRPTENRAALRFMCVSPLFACIVT